MTSPARYFLRFVPGIVPDMVPIILLHGSGGDENDVVPLAAELAPGSPALSIRGTVDSDGGFAFFVRRPDRSIDEADIDARIPELVKFIAAASVDHGFSKPAVMIGFSNGAIMAAALLLAHPALFRGAVLLRPLTPFLEDRPARLDATDVLIVDGEKDSRRLPGDGARLALCLGRAGARITHHVLPVGHAVTEQDERIARDWLADLR